MGALIMTFFCKGAEDLRGHFFTRAVDIFSQHVIMPATLKNV